MIVIFILAGSGVPNVLQSQQNGIILMSDSNIPQTSNAVAMYTSQGGQLTVFGMFGEDPLSCRPDLVSRCDHYFFQLMHPPFDDLFSDVVSETGNPLSCTLLDFIRVTNSLKVLV